MARLCHMSKGLDYGVTNQWVFFAVAFDGTASRQNVTFYVGTKEKGLDSVKVDLAVPEPLPMSGAEIDGTLTMGNSNGYERPFKGLLDNFAVYGSAEDGSGCLKEEQVRELFSSIIPN